MALLPLQVASALPEALSCLIVARAWGHPSSALPGQPAVLHALAPRHQRGPGGMSGPPIIPQLPPALHWAHGSCRDVVVVSAYMPASMVHHCRIWAER